MVGSTLALPLEEKAAKLTFLALRRPALLVSTLEPKLNNNSSCPTPTDAESMVGGGGWAASFVPFLQ